jgi:hypothetical protein
MSNEIISYILHFELPNSCVIKDTLYFDNKYCEIIKKYTDTSTATVAASAQLKSQLTLFNCFTQSLENKMVNCIKNKIYNLFAKQKNNYDDIIRL